MRVLLPIPGCNTTHCKCNCNLTWRNPVVGLLGLWGVGVRVMGLGLLGYGYRVRGVCGYSYGVRVIGL